MENQASENKTAGRSYLLGVDLDDISTLDRKRVLIVDDEPDTVFLLKSIIRNAGFDVLSAFSGKDAIKKCKDMNPDIVLLDLMMPEMDGWETLRYIREMADVPVIILSAVGAKEDVVRALQVGVDDYLTKPFFNAEVIARIRAVLRRMAKPHEINRYVFPNIKLSIDLTSQEVSYQGKNIHLTPKEFSVLSALAGQAPSIVGYVKISEAVWGEDSDEAHKRTKYLIYLLRRKFDAIQPDNNIILNIDRLGYKLQTET
jgi:two-component system KDP operon response regulator KdpE